MRSEGRDIDVGGMMDRWTLQMGYPVVTISKNQSEQLPTHYITVNQEHFLYGQEVRNHRYVVYCLNLLANYLFDNFCLTMQRKYLFVIQKSSTKISVCSESVVSLHVHINYSKYLSESV